MANAMTPFDRRLLRLRRTRAHGSDLSAGFLRDHAEAALAERLLDVKRSFSDVLLAGGSEAFAHGLSAVEGRRVLRADLAPGGGARLVMDEEFLPFGPACLDLVLSVLTLHWVNDLPGALVQLRRALRPDGLFLATMIGGATLWQLRQVLLEAESEMSAGAAPRVAPFAGLKDMGGLMQRAGFALPVVDGETITVMYDDMFALVRDLRAMGATHNPFAGGAPLSRATAIRAAQLYQAGYAQEGRIPATFELIHLAGWAPHESQQQPLRPGSARNSLADALGTIEHKLPG